MLAYMDPDTEMLNKDGENITDVILPGATVGEATQESLAEALVMAMKELAFEKKQVAWYHTGLGQPMAQHTYQTYSSPLSAVPLRTPATDPLLRPLLTPLLRPPAQTPCSDPLLRPPAQTPCSDPLLRPPAQTPCSDPLLRPPAQTPCSDPCSDPLLRPPAQTPWPCSDPPAQTPCSDPLLRLCWSLCQRAAA